MTCKGNEPHKYQITHEDSRQVAEVCTRCGDKKTYNKDPKGRVGGDYAKDHVREFAQPGGRTGKIFEQLYGKPKDLRTKGSNADFTPEARS